MSWKSCHGIFTIYQQKHDSVVWRLGKSNYQLLTSTYYAHWKVNKPLQPSINKYKGPAIWQKIIIIIMIIVTAIMVTVITIGITALLLLLCCYNFYSMKLFVLPKKPAAQKPCACRWQPPHPPPWGLSWAQGWYRWDWWFHGRTIDQLSPWSIK